ncbi:stonustoxin subunit beta-like [Sardina pilchardus]
MLLTAKQRDPMCKLELLNVNNCSEQWLKPGPQKYACELTLDSNTASRHLALSKRNQKATYMNKRQPYPDHPDRFADCPLVLCEEGLSGRHYWEVVWGGSGVRIGATYKDINRKGAKGLDGSATAWCMECCTERFTVQHANRTQTIPRGSGSGSRVGVYLDWPAGTLSFFSVCSGTLKLLHTFDAIFAEPLYPGFYIASESSVELC